MLHKKILIEHQRLQEQIYGLQKQISSLPEGKLICSQGNNCVKWYKSDGHNKVYLPKREYILAEKLAAKKYLSLKLEELEREKAALDFYLRHHSSSPGKSEQLLTKQSGYQELLTPYFKPQSTELAEWMNAAYKRNTQFPENLIHKTSSGIVVRSKSESMISHLLYTNKIPFRYECALHLGEATIYPDFTIRHPVTGQTYYWEHFGRMDNPEYVQNTFAKLQLFTSHGIIPSIQLITTYETQKHPLNYEDIAWNIEHYFL